MKALYTIAAIATFGFASAQKGNDISSFTTIAVSGKMTVTFVKSSKNTVDVTKGKAANLKIASSGGNMAMSLNDTSETFEATIYYTGEIQNIAVGGGAAIYSSQAFTGTELGLAISQGSVASIGAEVQTLQVAAASGSKVTVSGKATKIEAAVASGANFNSQKLQAADIEIVIATGAKAAVYATGTVDVNVGSAGELTIYGNPEKVNEVKAADGVIRRAK
jgi:hypothetical protein